MATTGTESIPSTWDDERDTAFFRVTASLFAGDFTYGASVLLASYDDEWVTDRASTTAVPASIAPTATAPAPHVTVR